MWYTEAKAKDIVMPAYLRIFRNSVVAALAFVATFATAVVPHELRMVAAEITSKAINETVHKDGGLAFEFCHLIGKESGLPYSVQIVPAGRALKMIELGEADLIIMVGNDRIRKAAETIAPLFRSDVIIIGKAGTSYKTLEDLSGKTVGVVNGAVYEKRFSENNKILKYVTNNYEQSISMLLADRYDAVVGLREVLFLSLHYMDVDRKLLGEPLTVYSADVSLHYSRKTYDPETASMLNDVIARLRKRNVFQSQADRYVEGFK